MEGCGAVVRSRVYGLGLQVFWGFKVLGVRSRYGVRGDEVVRSLSLTRLQV